MPVVPDTKGMTVPDAFTLIEGLGFVLDVNDPLELPTPWNSTGETGPPLWHRLGHPRVHPGPAENCHGQDLAVGTEIVARIYLQAGTRDYGRSDWSDFDEPDPL